MKRLVVVMVTEGCSPEARALFDFASNVPEDDLPARERMAQRFDDYIERSVDSHVYFEAALVPEAVLEQGGTDIERLLFDGLAFRILEGCIIRGRLEDGSYGFFTAICED